MLNPRSPPSPLLAEDVGAGFESAQRMHASLREGRRLRVALTEAEEGWRDALAVAKGVQARLRQREEEVQSLRTLLALAPADRCATPAAWQPQPQLQQQPQYGQQQRGQVGDEGECEQLRRVVNSLKSQLQAAMMEIGDLKASCQLSPIEVEALKRESEVSRRQLDQNEHFMQSVATALMEQTNGSALVYAELAAAVADLVDLASSLASCELGGLAVFMGQELQTTEEVLPAAKVQQLPGESHELDNGSHSSLQVHLNRIDGTNRRTTRMIQWIAAVTKYLRQQQVEQTVNVRPTPARRRNSASATVDVPPPAVAPIGTTTTPVAKRHLPPNSPAAPIQRAEMMGNIMSQTPTMSQPVMLQHHNQQQQPQPPHAGATGAVIAPDPPRLSQRREAGATINSAANNGKSVVGRALPHQLAPTTPTTNRNNGAGHSSPSRAHALAAVEQQLHHTTEVIRSMSEHHHTSKQPVHSPHGSDSQPQSPGSDTVQVANIVRRVAYDSNGSPAPKLKSSSRSPSPRKSRRRHRHGSSSPTPGLIQQIVTEKLHKVMADLLQARTAEEEWTQTQAGVVNVPVVVRETDGTLPAEQSARSEFCLNDCTVLEPANSSSETDINATAPKSKPTTRKQVAKGKRRAAQPRYAATTMATSRRRQLVRGPAAETQHTQTARSSSANSTPESGPKTTRRASPQYVSKLFR